MKEFKNILEAYNKVDFTQRRAVLATVVKVRGSSYRSPGARMLITDDGKWVGSISGGCLEGDALRKARQVMSNRVPLTVTYDTSEESNQNLGIGLGCNGIIDVLLEPLDDADNTNAATFFDSIIKRNSPVALATVFTGDTPAETGHKLLLTEEHAILHQTIQHPDLAHAIATDLATLFTTRKSEARQYALAGTTTEVFIELIQPTVDVILFGGGFDARPVSQLMKSLGWGVTVTDECVAHIAPLFFPAADKLALCQRQYVDRDFTITPYTACVLMSHNYEYDRDVLRKLLSTETPYIGILGPRKRFDKMVKEFSNEGITLTADDYHRIHAPIGLDIGAETPDEIAIAIAGEIQGKFSNRSGGFLKYRQAPIHHRDSLSDQVFKQVYLHTPDAARSAQGA